MELVLRGATSDFGYGDGDGYGDGGYGGGYGDGDGDGYGYGYGYGYGDGSGDGCGDGGYGYGYGDGSGGCGGGYGYDGDGDGYGSYWQAVLAGYAAPLGSRVAFWRSAADGTPSNGGHSTVARVGLVEELPGPLQICKYGFHATINPSKWKGERLWVVALHGEVQEDGDKLCALKREFLAEILW